MMMQVYLALLISPAWRSPARTISGQHGSGQIPAGCCFRSFDFFLFLKLHLQFCEERRGSFQLVLVQLLTDLENLAASSLTFNRHY